MDDRHARTRRRRADPRRRPVDGFRTADLARFVRLVDSALADLPDDLADRAAGLDVVVLEVPPDGDGEVPLAAVVARPAGRDRLELYRRPLEARARSRNELAMIVADVVAEELEGL